MIVNQRLLWLLGQTASTVYYDSGNSPFPLDVVSGSYMEQGCGAIGSPVQLGIRERLLTIRGGHRVRPRTYCFLEKMVNAPPAVVLDCRIVPGFEQQPLVLTSEQRQIANRARRFGRDRAQQRFEMRVQTRDGRFVEEVRRVLVEGVETPVELEHLDGQIKSGCVSAGFGRIGVEHFDGKALGRDDVRGE